MASLASHRTPNRNTRLKLSSTQNGQILEPLGLKRHCCRAWNSQGFVRSRKNRQETRPGRRYNAADVGTFDEMKMPTYNGVAATPQKHQSSANVLEKLLPVLVHIQAHHAGYGSSAEFSGRVSGLQLGRGCDLTLDQVTASLLGGRVALKRAA